MATFRTRLIDAMRMRNISAAELARRSGLSKPQISQYVNGKVEARQTALYKLATVLDVSEAWLMGLDVPMKRIVFDDTTNKQIQVALFGGDTEVTDEMWEEVRQFAEFVKAKHKQRKTDAENADK